MRLRYLHLQNYPPIKDIRVCFASGSQLPERECAIRFVVGLNGSGKSNLLRAVTEVFLALSDQQLPPFPVTLAYELGQRGTSQHYTFVVHFPGNKTKAAIWVTEKWFWPDNYSELEVRKELEQLVNTGDLGSFRTHIPPGAWPQEPGIAMPKAVLAYSTGEQRPWHSIFNRNQDGQDFFDNDESEIDINDERPAGWTIEQEIALQAAKVNEEGDEQLLRTKSSDSNIYRRPILLDSTLLKCALLAVALPQVAKNGSTLNDNLQALLERGGFHKLSSVCFRTHLQLDSWSNQISETAHDWIACSGEVISEPHPFQTRRSIYFDIFEECNGRDLLTLKKDEPIRSQGEALYELLGGNSSTPFELFTRLLELNQEGLFEDVLLRIRRQPVPDTNSELSNDDIGILRFEEFSDGEQMVLGRMALFYLLEDQHDALLLLDEPETHFNDKWKREIVDIIDDAIGKSSNDVLISTHSAIVLSDVFQQEIIMIEKNIDGSGTREINEPTFATDPSALMMTIFGSEDSIGKRAQEYIEEKLQKATGTPDEIVELEKLIVNMGTGFYRSELRTLLNMWRGNNA